MVPVVERASAASESKRPEPEPEPAPAPVVPSGPITVAQVRDAWPEILQRLEPVSRSSWMIAVDATPVAFVDDVLTLSFRTQADVAAFKKLAAGKGPSEDLRGAIREVLGIRVKYVARFDADATAEPPASGSPTPPADGPRADGGSSGATRSDGGERPRSTPTIASSAAAPVTEWAVARIPSDPAPQASAPSAPAGGATAAPALATAAPAAVGLAVDEEPEDATAEPVRTLTIPRDGTVLPATTEYTHTDDDAPDEDEFPPPLDDAPLPPRAPVAVERPAPPRAPRSGGIERVGEAVVRQVLGATFVREEPYTPPTRFS